MKPVFIHSAVDDAALTPAVFRVYCHVARRDPGNGAWASIESMAKTCQVNGKTVRNALKLLETRGWIHRTKRNGFTDLLRVTSVSEWPVPLPIEYPSTQTEGVSDSAGDSSQTSTPLPSQTDTPHPSQLSTPEGTPVKEIQEDTPKKASNRGVRGGPVKDSFQLRAEALMRRRKETPMTAAELRAWKTAKAVVEDTDADSWALLEWWYSLPTAQAPYRKTDFAALLNNWHAEIAKAQRNKTETPQKSEWAQRMDGDIPSKQSFPWQSVADLPPDLLKKLAAVYPDTDDQADVFATIKGREIPFSRDGRTLDEWTAIFFSGIGREDQADTRDTKGRAVFAEGNISRRKTGAAKASGYTRYEPPLTFTDTPGPKGWAEWVAREHAGSVIAPGGTHYTTDWHQLSSDKQWFIKDEMRKVAKPNASSAASGPDDVPWDTDQKAV